jgi:tetratricopeptide (TPR) repeat protein
MQTRTAFVLALLLSPAVALADGGGMPAPPTSGSPSWNSSTSSMSKEDADKVRSADLYAQAYREIDKAKAELADAKKLDAKAAEAKKASAQKRLTKSRDKLVEATKLDASNADAWNMLGFTRRKTGDHQGAFDAYWKCLALKPEHIGAHEYMGEAYLEEGKIKEAREELAWLKKKGNMATLETTNLGAAIDEWVAANPETPAPSPAAVGAGTPATTASAAADSTAK